MRSHLFWKKNIVVGVVVQDTRNQDKREIIEKFNDIYQTSQMMEYLYYFVVP